MKRFLLLALLAIFASTGTSYGKGKKDDLSLKRYELSKNYLLYTNVSKDERKLLGQHMRAVFKGFQKEMKFRTVAGKWQVYLLKDTKDYSKWCLGNGFRDMESTNNPAFYVSGQLQLVSRVDGHIDSCLRYMTHEAFHQFLDYFWTDAPRWVNEGFAVHYESGYVDGKTLKPLIDGLRISNVKDDIKNNKPSLARLLGHRGDAGSYQGGQPPFYRHSYTAVKFFNEKHNKPFRKWMKECMRGINPTKAFQAAFKKKPSEFDAEWHKFVQAIKLPKRPLWMDDMTFNHLYSHGLVSFEQPIDGKKSKSVIDKGIKILKDNPKIKLKDVLTCTKLGKSSLKDINANDMQLISAATAAFFLSKPHGNVLLSETLTDAYNGRSAADAIEARFGKLKTVEKEWKSWLTDGDSKVPYPGKKNLANDR